MRRAYGEHSTEDILRQRSEAEAHLASLTERRARSPGKMSHFLRGILIKRAENRVVTHQARTLQPLPAIPELEGRLLFLPQEHDPGDGGGFR